MKARKKLAFLFAGLLLLQVFCAPVLAAGNPEVAIAYDRAEGTVNVKAFGFGAHAMISLMGFYDDSLDYLNQYAADAAGELEATYQSSAEWANGGVIKIQVGSDILAEPIVRTMAISGNYIKSYTAGLTIGYPANILVQAAQPAAGLTAEVTVNGKVYSASFNGGESATIKVTEAIEESALAIRLMSGGEQLDSKPLDMRATPSDIWKPTVELSGDSLRVIFAAKIAESVKGYAATINDTASVPAQAGDMVLQLAYVELKAENRIVLSGVKFPDYFPSYSFTFALQYAK